MTINKMVKKIQEAGFDENMSVDLAYDFLKLCKKHELKLCEETLWLYVKMCQIGVQEKKTKIEEKNLDDAR